MEIQARASFIKISPRKLRLVAQSLKDLSLEETIEALRSIPKIGARVILKTLESAVANAVNNYKLDRAALQIKKIEVSEAGAFKRFRPVARGRMHPYKKRMSHIRVVLEASESKKGDISGGK